MAKVTGFLEYEREGTSYRPVDEPAVPRARESLCEHLEHLTREDRGVCSISTCARIPSVGGCHCARHLLRARALARARLAPAPRR